MLSLHVSPDVQKFGYHTIKFVLKSLCDEIHEDYLMGECRNYKNRIKCIYLLEKDLEGWYQGKLGLMGLNEVLFHHIGQYEGSAWDEADAHEVWSVARFWMYPVGSHS